MVPSAMSVISPSASGQPSKLGNPPYICSMLVRKTFAVSPKMISSPGFPVFMMSNFHTSSHHHGKPSAFGSVAGVVVVDVPGVPVTATVSFWITSIPSTRFGIDADDVDDGNVEEEEESP